MTDRAADSVHAPSRAVHPWVVLARDEIRFAVVGAFVPNWAALRDLVSRCEALGFDGYWVNDHPTRSMDPWTTLAALSQVTSRIRLMSLVSCVYYRSALQLARQSADVDHLSGGRLVLGLGIGDDEPEFERLGLEFPSLQQRQRKLEETIELVTELWGQGAPSGGGDGGLRPGPTQQPHVPVLIGGGGERVTLRQVARYADVANFGPHEWVGSAFSLADVDRKYEVLRRYCDEIGRPYEAVLRSHWTPLLTLAPDRQSLEHKRAEARIPDAKLRSSPLFATPGEAVRHFQALADHGVQYFLATVNGSDDETLGLLANEVAPNVSPGPNLPS